MGIISKAGFSALSPAMFNTFFTTDERVTEKIINSLLDTDLEIENVSRYELQDDRHPYVIADASGIPGRCRVAMTVINREDESSLEKIISHLADLTFKSGRNAYPLILIFDNVMDDEPVSSVVSMRFFDFYHLSFALAAVWMKMRTGEEKKISLLSDLMSTSSDNIVDEDIRRVYLEAYEKSGLREEEEASYSMWLASLRKEISALGINPGDVI